MILAWASPFKVLHYKKNPPKVVSRYRDPQLQLSKNYIV